MNELAIYKDFETISRAASALAKSGYFPDVKSEAQAIVKVLAGAELGLPPFASMTGIHIIEGKPVLGANVIATLVKNSGRYDYNVKKCDNTECVIEWYEGGQKRGESSFTIEEARVAGLSERANWKRYTSDMLFARAISRGARRFAPGIFGGSPVYTPDELGAETDPDGYVDASVMDAPAVDIHVSEHPEPEWDYPIPKEVVMSEKSSDGTPYWEIPTDKLVYRANAISKRLRENHLSEDEKSLLETKLDVIKTIVDYRKRAGID